MADYIYLLQTRLNAAQRTALEGVRSAARAHGMTVFLVGGAVRDLTSGAPVRDLDLAVQGDSNAIAKELQKAGGKLIGTNKLLQANYFNFPGGVRLAVESTLQVTYPKPGKPSVQPANILEDLRRRDFTANAMAISLNEGSYGLLMDPLNGVADIENRELRLVSNYGFIEDPVRMIRAARLGARLGWQMEERTQQRYENGKSENAIAAASPGQFGYELEEVFHEEDPLRVLRRLEAEGWAKSLTPVWNSSKANEAELERLRDSLGQLEAMGIHPDPSPAYFPLLTAKLNAKEVADLKAAFARPGFVEQVEGLEAETKTFGTAFSGKAAAAPSDSWKMLFSASPESVLWLAHSSKSAPVQAKFKAFLNDWPQSRQRIPYQLMQEMRITPDLPGYEALLEDLFFAIMDAKLDTPENARAFLEPFSPPAPPPPPNFRRRAVKKESKAKSRSKKKDDVSLELDEASESTTPLTEAVDTETATPADTAASAPEAAKPARKTPPERATALAAAVPAHAAATEASANAPAPAAKKTVTAAKPPTQAAPPSKAAGKPALKPATAKAPAVARSAKTASPAKSPKKTAVRPADKSPAKTPASPAKTPPAAKAKSAPAKKANSKGKTPAKVKGPAPKSAVKTKVPAKKAPAPAKKASAGSKKAPAPAKKVSVTAKKVAASAKKVAGSSKKKPGTRR